MKCFFKDVAPPVEGYYQGFFRDVAQSGSVLAWGARGRWFESSRPDFKKKSLAMLQGFFI